MQGCRAVKVLGRNVGAVLEKEPRKLYVTPFGRLKQRCRLAVVTGCGIGTMLDEEPCNFYMSLS